MANQTIISRPSQIITESSVGAVILLQNLMLILVICTTAKLHSTKYIFTASLGVTDVLVGLSSLSMGALDWLNLKSRWASSATAQAMFDETNACMTMLSTIHMAVIALERYLYIAHPFFYQRRLTPKATLWTVAILWLLAVAYVSSFFWILSSVFDGIPLLPFEKMPLFLKVSYFWFPYLAVTFITCVFYALILYQVRKHRRSMRNLGATNHVPGWRELAKSLKFFVTVFGIYFLMTCPFFAYDMTGLDISFEYYDAFLCLVTLNSATNFWVLLIVDEIFRHALKAKLCTFKTRITERCYCVQQTDR